MEPFLRATNQRVTVTIATDGESSDGDIASAMRPLQSLPVWVVIRLCTDQDSIVDYWNNIDKVLGERRFPCVPASVAVAYQRVAFYLFSTRTLALTLALMSMLTLIVMLN